MIYIFASAGWNAASCRVSPADVMARVIAYSQWPKLLLINHASPDTNRDLCMISRSVVGTRDSTIPIVAESPAMRRLSRASVNAGNKAVSQRKIDFSRGGTNVWGRRERKMEVTGLLTNSKCCKTDVNRGDCSHRVGTFSIGHFDRP